MRTQGTPPARPTTRRPRSTTVDHPRRAGHHRRRGLRARRADARCDAQPPRAPGRYRTAGGGLADAGYWHTAQMQAITDRGIEVLAPPDGNMREGKRPGWEGGPYQQMRDKLATDRGRELYGQRKITIEPVFGQIKQNRRIDRFMRRGRPPPSQSGGWSQRPTTCSSCTATWLPTPPDDGQRPQNVSAETPSTPDHCSLRIFDSLATRQQP